MGKQTIQLLPFYCIKTSTHSCYFFQKHWELQKCFLWKASGGCDPSVFFDHSAWFFPVIFSLVWLIIQGFRLSQAKVICIVLIHEAMLCFSAWSASLGKVVAQRHSTGATISIKGYTTPNTYLWMPVSSNKRLGMLNQHVKVSTKLQNLPPSGFHGLVVASMISLGVIPAGSRPLAAGE